MAESGNEKSTLRLDSGVSLPCTRSDKTVKPSDQLIIRLSLILINWQVFTNIGIDFRSLLRRYKKP